MSKRWNHKWFGYWKYKTKKESLLYSIEAWTDEEWSLNDIGKIVKYLNNAPITLTVTPLGDLICIYCGKNLGESSRIHSDGIWVWPSSLPHFVRCHNVCLPDEFVDHIRSRNYELPKEEDVNWSNLDWPNFDNIER